MKRFLPLISVCILLCTGACNDKDNSFRLEGEIEHLSDTTVTLYGIFSTPDSLITLPVKDGRFSCTLPLDTLTPLYLNVMQQEFPLFADKATTIHVKGDADNPADLRITGGEEQEIFNLFTDSVSHLNTLEEACALADSFILANPLSHVSIYLIDKYLVQTEEPDKERIERAINRLGGIMHDNPYIVRLQGKLKNASGFRTKRTLPLNNLPDTTGVLFKRSDHKDKYIVVSVWASWHKESQSFQDSLKTVIKSFAKRPVTFLQISLDTDRDQWMSAIRGDTLGGVHVCDLKGWNGKFAETAGIHSLPCNFVLDTNNRIVGRDKWGEDLEKFLKEELDKWEKNRKKNR